MNELLDGLAADSGLAIALVDCHSGQVAAFNNNSMCRVLNPGTELSAPCKQFCGKAFEKTRNTTAKVSFECFAGLSCSAVAVNINGREVVAIAGRAFVKSENYRRATERAISGEWSKYPPTAFFENILMTGSANAIDSLTKNLCMLEPAASADVLELDDPPKKTSDHQVVPHPEPSEISKLIQRFHDQSTAKGAERVPENLSAADDVLQESADIRSLASSMMKLDYRQACDKFLEFINEKHGLSSLIWFEIKDGKFRKVRYLGDLGAKSVEVGIASDNSLLVEASRKQMPLVLRERANPKSAQRRVLNLFPLTVGGEIRSALGIEGNIAEDGRRRRIARLSQSISSQLEILRLRDEVMKRDWLARAVRSFNESLKRMDADDFWLRVTQVSAELLGAERASLLVRNEKSNRLQTKAAVGSLIDLFAEKNVGSRVSRPALDSGQPTIVRDVGATGNAAPGDWSYKSCSYLAYPVSIGERKIAVLNFTDKVGGAAFNERDLELLQAIAPQIAMAIDRASLKDKAGEFEQLSVTDSLTGLLNRRYLQERLSEEIQRTRRHHFSLSLLMLDVDKFKSYNDTFGHLAGDAALRIIAGILKENLRGDDVAARYGGEEFAVLLPQTRIDEASVIAERIRQHIERTQFPNRRITASIGVASSSPKMNLPDDLVWAADRALYEAKGNGRNKVQLYDDFGDPLAEKVH
ncbi:MAG: diguanylate cyclase [Pyrinomonadaceae bacterium]